jgi:hypothetical protein
MRKREREGKGEGEKREGRQGKASGGKNSRSLARLSWPRMQPRLALFGQSGLVTAKPHSSLPLAVADPNFLHSLLFSRLYSISSSCISDPLASPFLVRQSHVRSLRRQLTECSLPHSSFDAYFHPCLFLRHFFPQICPIQLHASRCLGTRLPFLFPNVDPSPNLPSKTWFMHTPATTSIMIHDNKWHKLMSIRHFIKQL